MIINEQLPLTKPIHISVVLACFNRCKKTIACLDSLSGQNTGGITLDVHLVDDGSTDGTAESVQAMFPAVNLIQGTGTLYWGGAMRLAMIEAGKKHFDYMLLLNDDVLLHQGAISEAVAEFRLAGQKSQCGSILVGATTSGDGQCLTYSGFRRTSQRDPSKIEKVIPDNNRLVSCDTMNGNFIIIPFSVYNILGPIDKAFIHQLGDIDYGYRARAAGVGIWLARKPVGSCEPNERKMPYEKEGLGLLGRWKALNSPLGLPLQPWVSFMWRHGGVYGLWRLFGMYVLKLTDTRISRR